MTTPHNNTPTSIAAANAIRGHEGTMLAMVYTAIYVSGKEGLTREEITEETGIGGDTVRPRVVTLVTHGMVREDGVRKTRAGRDAAVLVAVREGGGVSGMGTTLAIGNGANLMNDTALTRPRVMIG